MSISIQPVSTGSKQCRDYTLHITKRTHDNFPDFIANTRKELYETCQHRIPDQGLLSRFIASIDASGGQGTLAKQVKGLLKKHKRYLAVIGRKAFDPNVGKHAAVFRPAWRAAVNNNVAAFQAAADSIRLINPDGIRAFELYIAASAASREAGAALEKEKANYRVSARNGTILNTDALEASRALHKRRLDELHAAKQAVVATPLLRAIPREDLDKLSVVSALLDADTTAEIEKRLRGV